VDRPQDVDVWETVTLEAALPADGGDPWSEASASERDPETLERVPDARAAFAPLPPAARRAKAWDDWGASLRDHLYRSRPLALLRAPELRASAEPGESEGDFRVRLAQAARERRDGEIEALRRRVAPKVAALEERLRVARERVERERSQYEQQKVQTGISLGATILGVLLGRKRGSLGNIGRATTTARGAGRSAREREDVARAEEGVEAVERRLAELRAQVEADVEAVRRTADPASIAVERVEVPARKSDVGVESIALLWTPWRTEADGTRSPLA
jgi:hypothetical protein